MEKDVISSSGVPMVKSTTKSEGHLVDVPDFVMPLKCNRKPAENISDTNSHFPYRRYQLYLQRLVETERILRRGETSRDGTTTLLESYGEDALKAEFLSIYGTMDEGDPMFFKLFQTFKEGRLEDMEEENKILTSEDGQKLPDMSKEFSEEEIKLFQTVRKGPSCGTEWFILPRKQLLTEDIIRRLKDKPVNLAQFDPELSIHTGSRVVPSQAASLDNRWISEKLSCNIYEITSGHPAGIVAKEFMTEYNSRYNHLPDIANLGYKNLAEFLVDVNNAVFTQGSAPHNDFMLYPTYLENLICSPMETFWRINHKFQAILQFFDGICKTEELVDYFEQLYHIELPYKSWGFASADEFVVYLVENVKWKSDFYVIQKASVFEKNVHAKGHYVVKVTDAVRKALQNRNEDSNKQVVGSPRRPFSFQPSLDCHGNNSNSGRSSAQSQRRHVRNDGYSNQPERHPYGYIAAPRRQPLSSPNWRFASSSESKAPSKYNNDRRVLQEVDLISNWRFSNKEDTKMQNSYSYNNPAFPGLSLSLKMNKFGRTTGERHRHPPELTHATTSGRRHE